MAPGQTAVSTRFWKLGPCSWQRMNLWPGADNLPSFLWVYLLATRWERISRCLVILWRRDSRSSVNHEKRRRLLGGQSVLLLLVRCKNQLLVIRNNKKQTRFFFYFFLFVPLKGQDFALMMWNYTGLESVGLLALFVFWGLILNELWIIFYTCYLGHVLGHSIKPRKLGKWAGKFFVSFPF
jgi:hypothetical protein